MNKFVKFLLGTTLVVALGTGGHFIAKDYLSKNDISIINPSDGDTNNEVPVTDSFYQNAYITFDEGGCSLEDYFGEEETLVIPSTFSFGERILKKFTFNNKEELIYFATPRSWSSIDGKYLTANFSDGSSICLYDNLSKLEGLSDSIFPATIEISMVEVLPGNDYTLDCIGATFDYNKNIKKVILPDSVIFLNPFAFSHSSIEEVKFSDSLIGIAEHCFENCDNLKILDIPLSVMDYIPYISNPDTVLILRGALVADLSNIESLYSGTKGKIFVRDPLVEYYKSTYPSLKGNIYGLSEYSTNPEENLVNLHVSVNIDNSVDLDVIDLENNPVRVILDNDRNHYQVVLDTKEKVIEGEDIVVEIGKYDYTILSEELIFTDVTGSIDVKKESDSSDFDFGITVTPIDEVHQGLIFNISITEISSSYNFELYSEVENTTTIKNFLPGDLSYFVYLDFYDLNGIKVESLEHYHSGGVCSDRWNSSSFINGEKYTLQLRFVDEGNMQSTYLSDVLTFEYNNTYSYLVNYTATLNT